MGSRDHKIKRELEEARKAGTLPPEKDAEGNLINPHIPEFMAKAPWYLRQDGPGLQHQRKSAEEKSAFGFTSYYRRGEFAGQATSYRKGACKNCGAMSHTDKDCTDRPRKVGAWKTGRDIKPDEFVPDGALALDFDAKRDRYNGYDPAEHAATIAKFEAAEVERKKLRAEAKVKAEAEAAAAKEVRRQERTKLRSERFERRAARLERKAAKRAAKSAAASAGGGAADGAAEGGAGSSSSSASGGVDAGASLAADAAARARGKKPAAGAAGDDADGASTASRASGSTGGRSGSPARKSSTGAGASAAAGGAGSSSSGGAVSGSSSSAAAPAGGAGRSTAAASSNGAPAGKAAEAADGNGSDDDDDDDSSTASSVLSSSSGFGSSDDDDDGVGAGDSDDDVRERDSTEILGSSKTTKGSAKAKMGVRNLRLREDRAKYLINLDVDSAYYDPKTRSMREDPFAGMAGHISTSTLGGAAAGADAAAGAAGAGGTYRGDLAWRRSGDYGDMMQAQMFAWEAAEQGAEVHLQANPTQLELMRKQVATRKAALEDEKKSAVLDRYGGAEHLAPVPRELLMGQGEGYVEYGRDGRAINVTAPVMAGAAVAANAAANAAGGAGSSAVAGEGAGLSAGGSASLARSRYEEDVWPGNHTSVWGSWWDKETRSWGYACCHSTAFSDYCTGRAGREAHRASKEFAERAAAAAASGSHAASLASAAAAAAAAAAASGTLTGSKRRLEDEGASRGGRGGGGGGSSGAADDLYSIGEAGYGGGGSSAGGSGGGGGGGGGGSSSGFGERSFKRARGGGGGGGDDD